MTETIFYLLGCCFAICLIVWALQTIARVCVFVVQVISIPIMLLILAVMYPTIWYLEWRNRRMRRYVEELRAAMIREHGVKAVEEELALPFIQTITLDPSDWRRI